MYEEQIVEQLQSTEAEPNFLRLWLPVPSLSLRSLPFYFSRGLSSTDTSYFSLEVCPSLRFALIIKKNITPTPYRHIIETSTDPCDGAYNTSYSEHVRSNPFPNDVSSLTRRVNLASSYILNPELYPVRCTQK